MYGMQHSNIAAGTAFPTTARIHVFTGERPYISIPIGIAARNSVTGIIESKKTASSFGKAENQEIG